MRNGIEGNSWSNVDDYDDDDDEDYEEPADDDSIDDDDDDSYDDSEMDDDSFDEDDPDYEPVDPERWMSMLTDRFGNKEPHKYYDHEYFTQSRPCPFPELHEGNMVCTCVPNANETAGRDDYVDYISQLVPVTVTPLPVAGAVVAPVQFQTVLPRYVALDQTRIPPQHYSLQFDRERFSEIEYVNYLHMLDTCKSYAAATYFQPPLLPYIHRSESEPTYLTNKPHHINN